MSRYIDRCIGSSKGLDIEIAASSHRKVSMYTNYIGSTKSLDTTYSYIAVSGYRKVSTLSGHRGVSTYTVAVSDD